MDRTQDCSDFGIDSQADTRKLSSTAQIKKLEFKQYLKINDKLECRGKFTFRGKDDQALLLVSTVLWDSGWIFWWILGATADILHI
jgi:hypothetical protein